MNKRNTMQKRIVSEIFCSMKNHPSAGMVYEEVHKSCPDISRATVYRILAEAAEEGKILRIKLSDENDRYDFTVQPHYHIVCRNCGAVADVVTKAHSDELVRETVGCEGFLVEDCRLEFVGICEKCRSSGKVPENNIKEKRSKNHEKVEM